jgi:hypothetical protein
MRKIAAVALIGISLCATISLALASGDEVRPKGVLAEDWVSMGPDAGFAVRSTPLELDRGISHDRSVHGVLMIRRNGAWVPASPDLVAAKGVVGAVPGH